jgi:hypothetical protein
MFVDLLPDLTQMRFGQRTTIDDPGAHARFAILHVISALCPLRTILSIVSHRTQEMP